MNKQSVLLNKTLVIGIIFMFICMSITPSIAVDTVKKPSMPTDNGKTLYNSVLVEGYTIIDALDLYACSASEVCYDDLSLKEGFPVEPDLKCEGELKWENIDPGVTIIDSFTIENAGDPGSELNWEISEYPYWGSDWTFRPDSGTGLTPEDGSVIIDVSVVVPSDPGTLFTGSVKVINSDNSSNFCLIDVYLHTAPCEELCCNGFLYWNNCIPTKEYNGDFNVINYGCKGSVLYWEIGYEQGVDYPWWGNWTFEPRSGFLGASGGITIFATVTAPSHKNQTHEGKILVKNCQNESKYCTIDATLITPRNKSYNFNFNLLEWLFERFPMLERLLDLIRVI